MMNSLPPNYERKLSRNRNRRERPYVCWAAVIVLALVAAACGNIIGEAISHAIIGGNF